MKRVLIDNKKLPTKLHFWNVFSYDMLTGVGRFCAHALHPSVLQTQVDPLHLPDLVRPDASMIARLIAVSHALGKHAYDVKTRTNTWSALEPRRKSHAL